MLAADPDAVLDRLRTAALGLPETDEVISHGIPAFRVAGKMFGYFRHDHHGDGMTAVCVKTGGRDEQEMLIEADPDLFSRPAYLWPSGWVAMSVADPDLDWTHVEARLLASWRLAAPKRLAHI
ncbi:MmcQ/YjbR family DNA-binding protein [Phenylobacterium sp.]|uniref:MmcQ/YjbR family DNA-binding protein n=1 Tax=Phenylobacterium sp. TaxID=1871053 RepID=UPI0012208049|nr:MmcQ/YjbR family DNA-binding protein [Phenylobacterium sp.]THD58842.1 MAG: MmcQ/YjbR family DNA-binding protein [Phenylobacterium sp.]